MFQRAGAILLVFLLWLPAGESVAQEKRIAVLAPTALEAEGFLQYLLPRFSLKTGIRITLHTAEAPDAADPGLIDLVLTPAQQVTTADATRRTRPLFAALDAARTYRFALTRPEAEDPRAEHARRLAEWLLSETGLRTVESFRLNEAQVYAAALKEEAPEVVFAPTGDIVLGEGLSLTHCGRCHVINAKNRMAGLGSTPSFAALKALADWDYRFQVFHVLNPHPSFIQIEDVTEPFDPMLPPPIAPIELTPSEIEAILAYVTTIAPADLGAPVQAK